MAGFYYAGDFAQFHNIGNFAELYESGEFSDLTIVCGGHKLPVHKAILCSVSSVLHRACTTSAIQGHSPAIIILHEDVSVVTVLLEFVYTGRFEVPATKKQTWLTVLLFIVRVYLLADKYLIGLLKEKALSEFQGTVRAVVIEFGPRLSTEVKEEDLSDGSVELENRQCKVKVKEEDLSNDSSDFERRDQSSYPHYPLQAQWIEQTLMPCIRFVYENTHDRNDPIRAAISNIQWGTNELSRSRGDWAELLVYVPEYAVDYMLKCAVRQ